MYGCLFLEHGLHFWDMVAMSCLSSWMRAGESSVVWWRVAVSVEFVASVSMVLDIGRLATGIDMIEFLICSAAVVVMVQSELISVLSDSSSTSKLIMVFIGVGGDKVQGGFLIEFDVTVAEGEDSIN